ncbi:MAG: tetratricopeptide repeat protein [Myxococcales bacterium]|nr:tetratricopeptide repeat protein [Polyangiaceae bacterium]MDW8251627.1 tetratricopeptide repeat protein [Myxococcales bacterium]
MRRRVVLLWFLGGCASSTPLPPRAWELNRLGAESLEQGDLTTAEARLTLALEFHPRFVEAMVNLGLVELSRGNHERARALFLRARGINENLPHPHHGLGVLAHRQLRLQDADAHYRAALQVDPAFLPSRANLGRLHFDAGSLEEARVQFARLAEASPHDGRGHGGLVETLLRLGRRQDAERALQRGIELAPEAPQIRLLLARRSLEQGDLERARSELLRLTSEVHDALPSAHAWLALVELAQGDVEAALRQATRALDLDQHEPVATFAMAQILEVQGAPEAAAWRRRVEEARPGVGTGPWSRPMPP